MHAQVRVAQREVAPLERAREERVLAKPHARKAHHQVGVHARPLVPVRVLGARLDDALGEGSRRPCARAAVRCARGAACARADVLGARRAHLEAQARAGLDAQVHGVARDGAVRARTRREVLKVPRAVPGAHGVRVPIVAAVDDRRALVVVRARQARQAEHVLGHHHGPGREHVQQRLAVVGAILTEGPRADPRVAQVFAVHAEQAPDAFRVDDLDGPVEHVLSRDRLGLEPRVAATAEEVELLERGALWRIGRQVAWRMRGDAGSTAASPETLARRRWTSRASPCDLLQAGRFRAAKVANPGMRQDTNPDPDRPDLGAVEWRAATARRVEPNDWIGPAWIPHKYGDLSGHSSGMRPPSDGLPRHPEGVRVTYTDAEERSSTMSAPATIRATGGCCARRSRTTRRSTLKAPRTRSVT